MRTLIQKRKRGAIVNPLFNWLYLTVLPVLTVLTVLVFSLTSCASTQIPQTPQQVAQGFWDAAITQNKDKMREYSSRIDPPATDTLISTWQNTTVTFSEVRLKDNAAWIDTTVKFTEHDEPVSLNFATVLKKEVTQWKVDQPKTLGNIRAIREEIDSEQNTAKKLMKKLRKLGDQFTQDIDKATTELKNQMPEIKKDMESLGKNIEQEFHDAWKQYEPAVEKNLQKFTDAINEAIEQAQKKKEQENQPQEPSVKLI
jgi:ABC-type transporter MlaC component